MGIILLCKIFDSDFTGQLKESKPGFKKLSPLITMFKVLSSIGANELDV